MKDDTAAGMHRSTPTRPHHNGCMEELDFAAATPVLACACLAPSPHVERIYRMRASRVPERASVQATALRVTDRDPGWMQEADAGVTCTATVHHKHASLAPRRADSRPDGGGVVRFAAPPGLPRMWRADVHVGWAEGGTARVSACYLYVYARPETLAEDTAWVRESRFYLDG